MLASWQDPEDLMDETRKANVFLIGESPCLFFSLCRSPLEKAGCQCHCAESHREMGKLLSHVKPDIVLSLNAQHGLSEIAALLAGSRVSMFYSLPVAEGFWWFPVLRNCPNLLCPPASPPHKFPLFS